MSGTCFRFGWRLNLLFVTDYQNVLLFISLEILSISGYFFGFSGRLFFSLGPPLILGGAARDVSRGLVGQRFLRRAQIVVYHLDILTRY